MKRSRMLTSLIVLLAGLSVAQERPTPFQPDSAAAYLRVLSVDIGPRPMGSPAEQRALSYAAQKFREWGFDEAYVHPFTFAASTLGPSANTNSGTAVGILRGSSGRILVIGAHIDSSSPDVPGANDDGSGSAVVLEVARVLAQRDWSSTIVVCLFGGEESGLKGSYHFADTFPEIDSVALMLQVDMANGTDWLLPLFETRSHAAPDWLVRASYEELERLGHRGLRYPVHFFTLNTPIGGASSDHEPFLKKSIPAIDFTTDVRDPIHTPQDTYANFRLGGLERSGDLVYRLIERFDEGVPPERTSSSMAVQFGGSIMFLSVWLLRIIIAGALGLGIWQLLRMRRDRTERRGENWKKVPGLKVFLLTLIAVAIGWISEDLLSLIQGHRTPWYSQPGVLLPFVFAFFFLGLLVSASLGRRFSLSADPYRYALRSGVWLTVMVLLCSLSSARLALYPAFGLVFVMLAFIARHGILSLALVVLGAYPTGRLMFSEVYEFVARSFSMIPPGANATVTSLFFILLFTLLLLPYAFTAASALMSGAKLWPAALGRVHPATPWITVGLLAVLSYAFMANRSAYTELWPQQVEVVQEMSTSGGTVSTVVRSNDYLRGVSVHFVGGDTTVTGSETAVRLREMPFNTAAWLTAGATAGGNGAVTNVRTWTRPYKLEVRYTPRNHASGVHISEADAGPYTAALLDGIAVVAFSTFPDTALTIPVSFRLTRADTVRQTVVATFVQPAVTVDIEGRMLSVTTRTIVRDEREVYVDAPDPSPSPQP